MQKKYENRIRNMSGRFSCTKKKSIFQAVRCRSLKRWLQWLGAWLLVFGVIGGGAGMILAAVFNVKAMWKTDTLPADLMEQNIAADENREKEGTANREDSVQDSAWEAAVEKKSSGDGKDVWGGLDVSELLVNKQHYLPTNYNVSLTDLKNGQRVADIMYADLRDMLFTGEDEVEGLSFLVASGYRTPEEQQELMQEEIAKNESAGMTMEDAYADACLTVAPAHFSEHETGLAVDIVAVSNQRLDDTQEHTPENQWLQENCYKYGFILRYPKGKEEITGFSYESWHFRYVGKEAAQKITEQGITLEEYLE